MGLDDRVNTQSSDAVGDEVSVLSSEVEDGDGVGLGHTVAYGSQSIGLMDLKCHDLKAVIFPQELVDLLFDFERCSLPDGLFLCLLVEVFDGHAADEFFVRGRFGGLHDAGVDRLQEIRHLEEAKRSDIPEEILGASLPSSKLPQEPEHFHLWVRMLFSCLVDSDFLDTEAFMDPEKAERMSKPDSVNKRLDTKTVPKYRET